MQPVTQPITAFLAALGRRATSRLATSPGAARLPVLASLVVCNLAVAACNLAAAACNLVSPAHRVTLLELYTSEGCNSCPPADRWLSGLRDRRLDAQVLPLAFHVDYWNDLGWVDAFSQPAFSARQRGVAQRNRSSVVYTPQLVLDGRDWRGWHGPDQLTARLQAINAEPAGATIRASARLAGENVELRGTAAATSKAEASAALIWLAVFEHGLVTAVGSGENRGRTLMHDYVVRALVGPLRAGADGLVSVDANVPLGAGWKRERLGIAVFAESAATGRILQASAATGCLVRGDAKTHSTLGTHVTPGAHATPGAQATPGVHAAAGLPNPAGGLPSLAGL